VQARGLDHVDELGNNTCTEHTTTFQPGVRMTAGHRKGDQAVARAVDGSDTCRRNARLDGRHTSVSGRAAARCKQAQGHTKAWPLGMNADTTRDNKEG
jgi:hypothetical protein